MEDNQRLEVQQLSIQAGNWMSQPANIGSIDAGSRRGRHARGNLHVIIEAAHNRPLTASLCEELKHVLTEAYLEGGASVTGALRNGVVAANNLLFERNLRSDPEHRTLVGLNCLAVRDADVYIAQAGPSVTNHVRQGRLQQYPSHSIWLLSETPGSFELNREPPVGLRKEINPDLFHLSLMPGDALIMSTTSLVRMASPGEIIDSATYTGGKSIRDNLETLAAGRDISALVVTISASGSPNREPSEPATGRETPLADDSKGIPFPPQEPAPAPAAPAQPPIEPERPEDVDDTLYADEWAEPEWQESTHGKPSGPRVDLTGIKDQLERNVRQASRGTQDFLARILPDQTPEKPASNPKQSISLSGRALVAVALAIPLVMLAMVMLTRVRYERVRYAQFDSIKLDAETAYSEALTLGDYPTAMREKFYDAMALTNEGLAITPQDETLASLNRRIEYQLDEMDRVTRLFHFWQLTRLENETTYLTDSSRIVINGIDLYVLNRGSDKVYKFLLNDVGDALQPLDDNPLLVQKGELRGGITLGDMVDIAWMKSGENRTLSSFVVLERGGSLLSYAPQQGIDVLPVADSDIWLKPQAIGSYFGNLYVLDPLLSRILKYVPTDNQYTNPPSDYIDADVNIDLTGAVDMCIDGNIYVLFADGRIVKFLKGDPRAFNMASLPSSMKSPSSIFVSGTQEPDALGFVYVADTGNERVVQFDKNGNFIRQFQTKVGDTQMQKLRGIYVDEEQGRLFLLSDQTLWLTNIPKLGE